MATTQLKHPAPNISILKVAQRTKRRINNENSFNNVCSDLEETIKFFKAENTEAEEIYKE